MFRCMYCSATLDDDSRSNEHIWPTSLGGDLLPRFFQTMQCCVKCNNNLGLFVDGPIAHDRIIGAEIRSSYYEYVSPPTVCAIPLIYLGNSIKAPEGRCIEYWLGPRGEHIYFIHERDRDEFAHIMFGDKRKRRKRDPGRVYVAFTKKHPYWIAICLKSIAESFPGASIFSHTTIEDSITGRSLFTNNIARFPSDEIEIIKECIGRQSIFAHSRIDLGLYDRFSHKVAIGIGFLFYGNEFFDTESYRALSQSVKISNASQSARPRSLGGIALSGSKNHTPFFHSAAGTSIILRTQGYSVSATIKFPQGSEIGIALAENIPPKIRAEQGLGYFICKPLKRRVDFSLFDLGASLRAKPSGVLELEALRTEIMQIDLILERRIS